MGPVRVLIVDDQEPFRQAAAAVVDLTDSFVVAGTEDSGEGCLAAVPELRPDLVLMDLGLPGIDGIEVARQLSALPHPPVVVLVSTYDEEEFGGSARSCGAVDYISKSVFGPERLAAAWARRSAPGSNGSTARNATSPSGDSASSR